MSMSQTRHLNRKKALKRLIELFPNCFSDEKGVPRKPLAAGIDVELIARADEIGLSRRQIRDVLWDYTRGVRYLRGMQLGSPRFALDGTIVGEVSIGAADNAKLRLAERLAQIEASRAAKNLSRKRDATACTPADAVV